MRTTLKIDEDVLQAARRMAGDENISVGKILSRLARRGLSTVSEDRPDRKLPVSGEPRGLRPLLLFSKIPSGLSGAIFIVLQLLFLPVAVVTVVKILTRFSLF